MKCTVQGIEEGMSQMAVQSQAGSRNLVWNFPIESWWRSCNPHGWPRLILCVYGPDARNNDIIHGYGSALLPFCAGKSSQTIHYYCFEITTLAVALQARVSNAWPSTGRNRHR